MGIFSSIGKSVARPYIRMGTDLYKSGKGIASSFKQIKEVKKKKEEEVSYVDAKDGREAFAKLAAMGSWTEAELMKQRGIMRRAKWVFMVVCALFVALFFIFGLTSDSVWLTLSTAGLTSIGAASTGALAIRHAIYQAQLEDRDLISFQQFMAHDKFWKRLFF